MSEGPILMQPIGFVRGGREEATDDDWGTVESEIHLDASRLGPEVAAGLEEFSHVEVVFIFDRVDESELTFEARHPRGRLDWPKVGILAQRAKARPNRIGLTTCELMAVEGLVLKVRGLDAINATPVLDIKPYMAEFGPRGPLRQPAWSRELMREYW
ncbi:MAG: SAM-dependent methyltransferase [Dehalococcoidia bacterium]